MFVFYIDFFSGFVYLAYDGMFYWVALLFFNCFFTLSNQRQNRDLYIRCDAKGRYHNGIWK